MNMYENVLPWWLTWIDGRAILLLAITIYFFNKARTSGEE